MTKKRLGQIIQEEIEALEQKRLDEALTASDYKEIKEIIRAEVVAIFFDLYKKRQVWA